MTLKSSGIRWTFADATTPDVLGKRAYLSLADLSASGQLACVSQLPGLSSRKRDERQWFV